MDIRDIKDLIITIDKTSIEKVEIEKTDIKIMITKKVTGEINDVTKTTTGNLEAMDVTRSIIDKEVQDSKNEIVNVEATESLDDDKNIFIVKSPIVGTFYEAASPDTPPFVKVGDKVEKGQTLCIIEAMKIMNEIECEVSGEIIEIFVSDEDIVEYGQPLMRIRR